MLLLAGCASATAGSARWRFDASMSQRRSYVAAAEVGGRIYAAGGMVGETGRFLRTFARFDPRRDVWTTLEPLPVAIRAGAGAALDGRVYVIGGQTARGDGRQVLAYDVRSGRWTARAPLPRPEFNHAAASLGGRIYVAGGYAGGRELRGVFAYDPRADRWRAGPPLPKPMELLSAAVADGRIHAIWERTYEIWDGRRWLAGPPPQVPRHALSVFAADGRLYVVGGCTVELHDTQLVESRALPSS